MRGGRTGTSARRRTRTLSLAAALIVGSLATAGRGAGTAFDPTGLTVKRTIGSLLRVSAIPWGPTDAEARVQRARVIASSRLQRLLAGSRYRLLSFKLADGDAPSNVVPHRYVATIYDYTKGRTITARGEYGSAGEPLIHVDFSQPLPSYEEFLDAVATVKRDPVLGPLVVAGRLAPYRPMPPLVNMPTMPARVLTVGLRPTLQETARHEIVGVDVTRQVVIRFATGAPPNSLATEATCGPSPAADGTSQQGESGEWKISVTQGAQTLWQFVVIRPADSSGTNGSGIELRHVDYLGYRVLERAHAPILNVKYENSPCGPYRDWAYEEGMFDASGVGVSPGLVECDRTPKTIAESGIDEGTFRGVAVDVTESEVILVSELEAGWYRYVSEWRLGADGTIRPRFHFGAVANSCTCSLHNHHLYWRFDFAIHGQQGNSVEMHDGTDPSTPWQSVVSERRMLRQPNRVWRVEDAQSDSYTIYPGPTDGSPDTYGVGDVWVLRNHVGEIDDGRPASESSDTEADIDAFIDGESVRGQDVVVWYAAHVRHGSSDTPAYDIGPELRPSSGW